MANIIVPRGLVAYWPLNGNADDIVGGNNGTLVNSPTWTTGKIGQGLQLDGVDQYMRYNTETNLPISKTNNWSFSAWVNNAGGNAYTSGIMACMRESADRCLIKLQNGEIRTAVWTGSAYIGVASSDSVISGFTHVVYTFATGTSAGVLYINGAIQSGTNGIVSSLQTDFFLGYTVSGEYFNGILDDVRIYNRALTADEVRLLYQGGLYRMHPQWRW